MPGVVAKPRLVPSRRVLQVVSGFHKHDGSVVLTMFSQTPHGFAGWRLLSTATDTPGDHMVTCCSSPTPSDVSSTLAYDLLCERQTLRRCTAVYPASMLHVQQRREEDLKLGACLHYWRLAVRVRAVDAHHKRHTRSLIAGRPTLHHR